MPLRSSTSDRTWRFWQLSEPVTRTAGGDSLNGGTGDWLIQYAPGDYGIVESTRFERVYRLIRDENR